MLTLPLVLYLVHEVQWSWLQSDAWRLVRLHWAVCWIVILSMSGRTFARVIWRVLMQIGRAIVIMLESMVDGMVLTSGVAQVVEQINTAHFGHHRHDIGGTSDHTDDCRVWSEDAAWSYASHIAIFTKCVACSSHHTFLGRASWCLEKFCPLRSARYVCLRVCHALIVNTICWCLTMIGVLAPAPTHARVVLSSSAASLRLVILICCAFLNWASIMGIRSWYVASGSHGTHQHWGVILPDCADLWLVEIVLRSLLHWIKRNAILTRNRRLDLWRRLVLLIQDCHVLESLQSITDSV